MINDLPAAWRQWCSVRSPLTTYLGATPQLEGEMWRLLIFWGVAISLLWILFKLTRKLLTWELGILWAFMAISAYYVLDYPSWPYFCFDAAFKETAGQSFAMILVLPMALLMVSNRAIDWAFKLLNLVMVYELICVWTVTPGLHNAPSFDLAFLALFVPFAFNNWFRGIIIASVLFHQGSTAMLILAAQGLVILWGKREYFLKPWPLAGLVAALGAIVYKVIEFNAGDFTLHSERLYKWKIYFEFWERRGGLAHFWVGTGPGSFTWFSLMTDNYTPPLFIQMHSDWLQVLFENGIIGLGLTLLAVGLSAYRARKNPQVLCGILGASMFALTYHPLRFFPSAFLVALIFRKSLNCKMR